MIEVRRGTQQDCSNQSFIHTSANQPRHPIAARWAAPA